MDAKNITGIISSTGNDPKPDPPALNPNAVGIKRVWQKPVDRQGYFQKHMNKATSSPYTPLIIGGIGFLVVMILRRLITNRS